ncbi:DgyrCDS4740 [Dimorphilus gyrociliatus]|uniref:Tetraspanin n=1 Tax=Dimorphilus gyrociliatus TaxID=2664684 RepID=A0A7I8VK31_9ANNE|nr:DgyrCDS4740 [Dimorphilus gyrociliatus]
MVEGGMKCVKYLLFTFNLLFFFAGLALIIAGAVVQTRFREYIAFFGNNFSAAAIVLIVVGGIILLIGFFGCCGAYKESYCMTMTFAVILGLIFVLEIAVGIGAAVMKNKVRKIIEDKMTESMKNYNDDHEGVKKAWDSMQEKFECCGVKNSTDWNTTVPDSCDCPADKKTDEKICHKEDGKDIFKRGCIDGISEWVEKNVVVVVGVGIGFAFLQLIGIAFACCLARTIKKEYEVV